MARQGPRTRWESFLPGGEGCPLCMTIKGTFAKSSESSLSNFLLFFPPFLLFLSGTRGKQRARRRERALAPAGTPAAGAASSAAATPGGQVLSDCRDRRPRDGDHSKPRGAANTAQPTRRRGPPAPFPWPPLPVGPCRMLRTPHSSQSLRPRGLRQVGGGGCVSGQH